MERIFDEAVETVLPVPLQNTVVWHYTRPQTAESIIEGCAFWATSVTNTNDRSEMLFGMALVKVLWGERSKTSSHRKRIDHWIVIAELQLHGQRRSDSFVLCASTERDSISQWDRYGHCALGISTAREMTKQPQRDEDGGRLAPTFTTGWRSVVYEKQQQRAHISRLFDVLEDLCGRETPSQGGAHPSIAEIGVECLLRSIVYLKDNAFHSEKEARLYGQAIPTGALVLNHLGRFGPSKHILVRARVFGDAGNDLPIVEVRIGYVTEQALADTFKLQALLETRVPSVPVELVDTPFRR